MLRFKGKVIKRIRGRKVAKNVVRVLDVFQEEDWPEHILDPLPGGPNKNRVQKTVQPLNKRLEGIRFSSDGSGEGFVWKPLPSR